MRRPAIGLIFIIALNLLFPFIPQKADAADLTNTFIRLDRQRVSTSTGALVCSTTPASDNGTENFIQIVFPTGFTVNQNASNWTVSTSDLPAGATAWPGISTANSVSGQIVTFPSSDLSASTQYCFKFSSGGTLTTPLTAGSYPGFVRTRSIVNTTIDSVQYGLSVVTNDGIVVTATAPAQPTDFQANLQLIHPSNGEFPQNAELIYKLTYGSYLPHSSNIIVEVNWDLGTISGNSVPTVDVLKYLVGTATNGYNNTPAVVDVTNRSISWTHSPIPGDTNDQVIYFRLSTNSQYQGSEAVSFSVNARVIGPGTQTADSTVASTYKYDSDRFQSSSGTSTTSTPTPTPSVVLPDASLPVSEIASIDIRSVSQNQAQIAVTTVNETSAHVNYGKATNSLNQSVSVHFSRSHLITLPNLDPNSRYYFRVTVTDRNGNSSTSDIYLIDTASKEFEAGALDGTLIVTSDNVILHDPIQNSQGTPIVVIPTQKRFSFKFAVDGYDEIQSITGVVRNNNVLGLLSSHVYANTDSLEITEINPGSFIGSLATSNLIGEYGLILRIRDFNGNIAEQRISNIKVVDPLTVINSQTKNGIERAKTTLYYYNQRLKIYEPISNVITPINNNVFSDENGVVDVVLPFGKYRVEVLSIGYKPKTVEFELSQSSSYPIVELNPAPFSILTFAEYHLSNSLDAVTLLYQYIDSFKSSTRFLELVTIGVILLFTAMGFFQLSRIFGVPILLLPFFALYHFVSLFHRPQHQHFIQGKVVDISTNVPVEGVLLHFTTPRGKVFAHTRTNIDGDFTISIKNPASVKISVSKKGYSTFSKLLSEDEIKDRLTVTLSKLEKPVGFGYGSIAWYFKSIGESFFETFLVLTIIVELIFAQQFGIEKVLLPLIISVGNLLLWSLHSRPRKPVARRA